MANKYRSDILRKNNINEVICQGIVSSKLQVKSINICTGPDLIEKKCPGVKFVSPFIFQIPTSTFIYSLDLPHKR